MMVKVLDHEGQPVSNTRVRVIIPGDLPGMERPLVIDPRNSTERVWSSLPRMTFDTVIYSARSDGGGL